MLGKNLSLRLAGPTILVSILLLAMCIGAAVVLYRQQANTAEVLEKNVLSTKSAHDLEDAIVALLDENAHTGNGTLLRIRANLDEADELADRPSEQETVRLLRDSFERYLRRREEGSLPPSATQDFVKDAVNRCGDLQKVNAEQVLDLEREHRQTVRAAVAGLVIVGTVGSLAGLLLGYSVARGLRRSFHQLSVRVRDAADRLGQELPAVVLTEEGDFQHLHEQMQGVVREIEQVVAKLQQREREVLRAEQLAAVGQLAAGVAHELRNPLTSIKLLVQTNREEAAAHHVPDEDLRLIEQEIRRMERSLQTFLDFARPPRPERRPLNLLEPIERTVGLVGGRARKQHVAVRVHRPDAPVQVEADADQIQQLLVNLVLNALDVMPHGGDLDMDLHAPRNGYVEMHVRDTGPGIAQEMLPRLFRPFVSGKETGLGLGLVISQRIAENHGGSLRGGNRPEGGACFVVRLPTPGPMH